MHETAALAAPGRALPTQAGLAQGGDAAAAARAFEGLLLGELSRMMFETSASDGLFGGGEAEGIYRSMFAEHVGAAMASRGGLGLVPGLTAEILALQQADA